MLCTKQMGIGQKQGVGWQPWDCQVLRTRPVGWHLLVSSGWQLVLEEMILEFVILEQPWHGVEEEIAVEQSLVSIVCAWLWFSSKSVFPLHQKFKLTVTESKFRAFCGFCFFEVLI